MALLIGRQCFAGRRFIRTVKPTVAGLQHGGAFRASHGLPVLMIGEGREIFIHEGVEGAAAGARAPQICQHRVRFARSPGPGLARDYAWHTGAAISAEVIVARSATEAAAAQALARYENRLARAIASVINVLDPEVIVLGGGLSNIERLYKNIPALWGKWVFSDTVRTRLVRNAHGDSSGVRGAAWLWP